MGKKFFLKVSDGQRRLNVHLAEVTHFKANREYVYVFTLKGKRYCKSMNIGKVEKLVKGSKLFFKSHKSFLLNKQFLNGSEKTSKGTYAIIKNNLVPVARRKQYVFNKLIGKITVG